ncbi:phosphonate metabolism transcriptional regulator PhnF [Halobacillus litoralis]|uniref:phosphonate metabolism transcriptional regulator PhnF n=1 Tax=Halobacillus litoralis TaxID=45668 RepID=UPI001CD4CA7F|nr:phosphonate metabolism transcriptional regulator PhnF [Halobacillus litoralis]MCA0970910.1 phosphonate metabolism transcriptional regulator PhnF [Halobacillus litoralis]
MVDKRSPMPMYYQIEEDLKQRMDTGEFRAGEMIPSERELSEHYDVSRMTVRQAMTNMVNDGYLYREKGKGTFVAEQKIEQPLQGMTSFTEDMKQRGMEASSRLIAFERQPATKEIAGKLALGEDADVFLVQRIRYADKKPMAVETTYLPASLLPELTEEIVQGSLYEYVENELNRTIEKATQMIEATVADDHQSKLLDVPEHSAVLLIERNSVLTDGTPFEVVKSAYRADRYKFISDIYR